MPYIGGMTIAADPRAFLYRSGELDPDSAQRLTAETLAKADDGELYLQYRKSEAFGFDDGRLKTASYDTQSGFGLRAVSGEMTAFAHSNELSAAAIRRAGETMALIDPSARPKATPPQGTNRHLYTDADPIDLVPFADKVNLCLGVDAAARARDPRVAQVSVGLSGSWSVVEIVRPDGFVATDIRPLVRLNVSIVVEANGRRETGNFGIGGRYLYDRLMGEEVWNRAIDEALAQALVNLESVDAPAGEMTVLLGPGWPGVLLHEAVGHGLEGDFNRKGTSAFSGRIGERVAAAGVTVVDDGSIMDRRGSLSIDDEGTPTQENVLIEDGILKGYMQDRLNARLMGEEVWNRAIDEALAQALVNLESVDAPAGEMTVLLGPGWPGVLLHEAVGHGLEGDFNRKGTSAFSGRIGERVAAAGVTVVDDGSIMDRRGSLSIDDEGTPTQENVLIEDGILKGYMQDRLNARLMGVAPTGNGRRQSFEHAPMPRMTNTFMRGGNDDPAELMSRVKKGIYAKSFGGGQVDIVSGKFVFSCTEAYRIENGTLGAPIKGATLIGDGPTVLTKVTGIGNDFALDEGIGMCGKDGQGVPAGVGQPTLLVSGLTVGGTAV